MLRVQLFGVADHAEQTDALGRAVNREVSVENLVAAVFAVGLRKHHQFNVGRVALELRVQRIGVDQVVNFVRRQCQAKLDVGLLQCRLAAVQHVNRLQRRAVQLGEQSGRLGSIKHHAFGHAVVQQRGDLLALDVRQGRFAQQASQSRLQRDAVLGDALDAFNGQATVVGNVGGFRCPRRHGAETRRNDEYSSAGWAGTLARLAIRQQRLQLLHHGVRRRVFGSHQMHKPGADAGNPAVYGLQAG